MRGVRFLVLLLVAIPIGWYAYYDSKRSPAEEGTKKEKLFNVEADKVEEISVKSESGDRTTLRRTGTTWAIVQPAAAETDEAAVSGIVSNLSSLEIQRVVDDNPPDLAEYGLAQPRVELTFKSGGQEHRLLIGGKTPTGSDLYAKVADQKKVFLISSYLDSTFNRRTFDLRNKTALKFDPEKVDALEISTPQSTVHLAKVNGEWEITAPVAARGDFAAVQGLLEKLRGAEMKTLAPETGDARTYGLEKPAATVKIGAGSSQATLVLGTASADGSVYAKDLSRPQVFTLEKSLLDDLKPDPSQYRQKDLFDARSFNATRLEIVRDRKTFAFEKTTVKDKDGKEEEKWRQLSPSARDTDGAKLEALLSAATAARATSFVESTAKTGLDKPELTVAISFDQGKQDRVTFARSGAEGFAARAGSPGAAKIDPATIDAIVKALDAIAK